MLSVEEIKSWYNARYREGLARLRPYDSYPAYLSYLGANKGKLLDVGCGRGFLLLAAQRRGLETFGIDISEEAVCLAETVSPHSKICVGSAEDLTFDNETFDYITCLGALEHFLDMDKGLGQMLRVAKPKARFLIVVPNSNFIFWKLRGRKGTEQQELNERILTLVQWKNIFTNCGFEILSVLRERWFMKFSAHKPLGAIKRLLSWFIWLFIPLTHNYQFVFILKKKCSFQNTLAPLKILYLTRKYPPSLGGMQRVNYHLIGALRQHSSVEAITWGYSQIFLPLFILKAVLKGIFFLFTKRYDIIVIGDALLSPLGIFFRALTSTPTICIAHGLDITFPNALYQSLISSSLRQMDRVICVSEYTRQQCICRGIEALRLKVIPNGVPPSLSLDKKESLAFLRKKGIAISPEHKILLTVGRLVKRKGVSEFLKNVFVSLQKEYPNIMYLIVGEGECKKRISNIINEFYLGEQVLLLGGVSDEILNHLYAISDIFVMPNIEVSGDSEGFGIVALEASSHKVPVVAYSVDGLKDSVQEAVNGLLAPAANSDMLREKIAYLLQNDELRMELGRRAQEFSKKFSWQTIAGYYLAAMRDIC